MKDITIEVEGRLEQEDIPEFNIKAGTAVLSIVYCRDEEVVGSVEVNNSGQISASIEDDKVKDIVLQAFKYINGKPSKDLESMGFIWDLSNDIERWNRIRKFVAMNGYEIHYSEDKKMDDEFKKI